VGEIKKNKNQLKNDFKVRNSNKKITIKSEKKKTKWKTILNLGKPA
jgi:hypothetical protein